MNENDKPKFLELMNGLAEIYDKDLSPGLIDIYWDALSKFSIEEIKKATGNIVSTHKYATFPKPAQFIEYINPPEDLEARAAIATNELLGKLAAGNYKSFCFDDPVIAVVVQSLGGWQRICETFPRYVDQEKEQMWWLKDFERLYRIYAKRPLPEKPIKMIGVFQRDNKAMGFVTDESGQSVLIENDNGEKVPLLADSDAGKKYLEDGGSEQAGDLKVLVSNEVAKFKDKSSENPA